MTRVTITDDAAINRIAVTDSETEINLTLSQVAPGTLTQLTDVLVSGAQADQVLTYDGTRWVNQAPSLGVVVSVNGLTGAVELDTDDIAEGTTNLYYTDQRVFDKVADMGNTGLIVYAVNGSGGDVVLTTSDIAEGTNLYYTDARVNDVLSTKTTTDLAEGSNLYFTTARADSAFDTRLTTKTTTDLAEGSNLYFTTSRARSSISGGTGVTYTPATGVVAIGQPVETTSDVQFNTVNIAGATTLSWNADEGTLEFPVNNEVTLQIGQENLIHVKNLSGATLNNGQVVRVTGASGSKLTVDLANNTSDAVSADTIAVMTQTLNNNGVGYATTEGLVRGLNTSSFTEGAVLWLDGAGVFTQTKPLTPLHLVQIGYVVRSHPTVGSIFVCIKNGWEIDELHDVLVTAPVDGEVLTYNGTTNLWENTPPAVPPNGYTDSEAIAAVSSNADNVFTGNLTVEGDFVVLEQVKINNFEFPITDVGATSTWAGNTKTLDMSSAFIKIILNTSSPTVTFDTSKFFNNNLNLRMVHILVDYISGDGVIQWPADMKWQRNETPNFAIGTSRDRYLIKMLGSGLRGWDGHIEQVFNVNNTSSRTTPLKFNRLTDIGGISDGTTGGVLRTLGDGTFGVNNNLEVLSNKVVSYVPLQLAVYSATQLRAITGTPGMIAMVNESPGTEFAINEMAYWSVISNSWRYVRSNSGV